MTCVMCDKNKKLRSPFSAKIVVPIISEAVGNKPGVSYQSLRDLIKPYAKDYAITDSILQAARDLAKIERFGTDDDNVRYAKVALWNMHLWKANKGRIPMLAHGGRGCQNISNCGLGLYGYHARLYDNLSPVCRFLSCRFLFPHGDTACRVGDMSATCRRAVVDFAECRVGQGD